MVSLAQVIKWVDEVGSIHVDVDVHTKNEQEAQQLLIDHREFMENEATVSMTSMCQCLTSHFTVKKRRCQ